jgi:uncharacterized repeat protein (TIGR01451 family)
MLGDGRARYRPVKEGSRLPHTGTFPDAGTVLLLLVVVVSMLLQPAAAQTWPTEWILIGSDGNENGPTDNFRDVEYAYYNYDDEYLYLRICMYDTAAFKSGGQDARFKWFIDLDNNLYKTGGGGGGNVIEGEYLLFVEDLNDDGVGEVYLLNDTDGDGSFNDDWGQSVGSPYKNETITNLSIAGYNISGKCVNMYVRCDNISDPVKVALLWVTDQENPNLDQAPTTDFPDSGIRLGPYCVQCRPKLLITKYDFPDPVKAGTNLTYTIIYENNGTLNATNVTVTEVYDANVTFVSADPLPDSGTNDTWTIPNLPVGLIFYINVTVRVSESVTNGTILHNFVNITSDEGGVNNHTAATLVVGAPVLEIAKSAFPAPVEPGETLTYTILFENVGDAAATNTILTDTLPAHVTYLSAAPKPNQTLNENRTLVWSIGLLPSDELRIVTITVTVDTPLPCGCDLVNFVNLTADGVDEVNHTEETKVVATPRLDISKFDYPEPVEAGGVLTYTIVINNTGCGNATNVTVTEVYDANVTFVSATPAPDTSNNNTWTFAMLNASESEVIAITVMVASPLPNGTLLLNYANVTSEQNVTNQIVISTTVISAPVLLVEKADWPDPVAAGKNITYVITYENLGNMNATNVTITEFYDANVTFISATPAPDPGTNNTTWTIGTLPPNGKQYINITVLVNDSIVTGTLLTNYVTITSEEGVEENDTEITEIGEAELVICKQDYPDPVVAGNNLTYTLCYENFGTVNATNTTITDVLPPEVTYLSASPEPNLTLNDSLILIWNIGELPPNEHHTITITVRVNVPHPGGIITDYANITADEKPEGNDTEETTIISLPVLELVKLDSPDPVRAGNQLTYTLIVNNSGTANATNVILTDLLCDPNISFVSSTPLPDDATNTTWTNASIAPGESWQILITVAVNGSLANGDIVYNCVNMTSDQTGILELWQDTRVVAPEIVGPKIGVDQNGPSLEPGDVICYTVWINNTGDVDATDNPGNEFEDPIPEFTTFTGPAQASSGTVQYNALNDTIIWNGNITAGGSITVTFCVTVDLDVPSGTTIISNQGTVYYDSDGDGENNAEKPTDNPVTEPYPDPTELPLSISEPVPALTSFGLIALISMISVIAALRIRLRKRR